MFASHIIAANVAAILSSSLKDENSPFLRLERGTYTLKENIKEGSGAEIPIDEDDAAHAEGRPEGVWHVLATRAGYLDRKAEAVGSAGLSASDVNFSEQFGVYLLTMASG